MAVTDPYAVLGLDAGASLEDIARAYRRQVRRWHPDVSSDPAAAEHFRAATAAYQQLIAGVDSSATVRPVAVRRIDADADDEPPLVAGPVHVAPIRPRKKAKDD